MRILAIDTALGACAAAVFDSEKDAVIASESLAMGRGHAEALMPLLDRMMNQAAIKFTELDRIAVTVGPGSFTGLRVGIAAARGIALTVGRPAVGISTLAAYAAPHIAIDRAEAVVSAIDARHAQIYVQVFGAGGRTLMPPRHVKVAQFIPPSTGRVHLTGSGAQLLAEAWPADAPPRIVAEPKPAPDIACVARLGIVADAGAAPPKPLYLRPPDARPQGGVRLPRQ